MSIVGGDWDAPQWWADTEPDPESWCPWHGIHTRETGKQDTGFKIWGPDENENGWNCQCSHGCGKDPERGAREGGKQDRAKFLYTKALDAGVTDADEFAPYITNLDVEAKWRAYRERDKEKTEKRATWDEAEALGKNETRMLALVGRLNKPLDGAKAPREVRRAQGRHRGNSEAQGQEGQSRTQGSGRSSRCDVDDQTQAW